MNKKSVMIGLLAAVATGIVAGILLAPDKGSATRKKLSRKSKRKMNELKDGFNDFSGMVKNKVSGAKQDVTEKVRGAMPSASTGN